MSTIIKKVPDVIDRPNDFCPGCTHGVFYRIIQECVEELGYKNKHITVLGVGCSCNINPLTSGDKYQCAHGRAAAVATGMKRVRPDTLIFTYQGDGDCGVIGFAETVNAAYRNEKISVFTVNNLNFGMTGGQMSWTTLEGQATSTSPEGRDCASTGRPLKLPELIASQFDVAYAARCSVHDAKAVAQARQSVKNALEAQVKGEGYSIVELLGICPTNWGMSPVKSRQHLQESMIPVFPLGEFKKRG
jgi:2-oxoglutarate ferredoxin oxidoreductase subunit beta